MILSGSSSLSSPRVDRCLLSSSSEKLFFIEPGSSSSRLRLTNLRLFGDHLGAYPVGAPDLVLLYESLGAVGHLGLPETRVAEVLLSIYVVVVSRQHRRKGSIYEL